MPSQPFHLASRRPFVVALALLATSCGAGFSDLPSLSPWSDAELSLSIPSGWQASRAGSSVMVLADPRNPNAGMLQLLVEGGGSGAAQKVAALAAKAAGAGHGARLDPTYDADASGHCAVTANRYGNSDVDWGPAYYTSPRINLADFPVAYVSGHGNC